MDRLRQLIEESNVFRRGTIPPAKPRKALEALHPSMSAQGPRFGQNAPMPDRYRHIERVAVHGMPVMPPASRIAQVNPPAFKSSAGANGNAEVPPFRKARLPESFGFHKTSPSMPDQNAKKAVAAAELEKLKARTAPTRLVRADSDEERFVSKFKARHAAKANRLPGRYSAGGRG